MNFLRLECLLLNILITVAILAQGSAGIGVIHRFNASRNYQVAHQLASSRAFSK
jgi:hypothetical protein